MKKSFLVNFFLLLSVNILVKPAWLFADLLVQRETQEAYGQYFVLFNLSVMLNMLLDFGISNYNNRKVAGNVNKFENYLIFLLILLSNPQTSIYHKYYDPFLIIILFSLVNIDLDIKKIMKFKTNVFIYLYFTMFLILGYLK